MISAVIVTYNKLELLKEAIDAILSQTIIPDSIIIVDNASTDGTKTYIENLQAQNSIIYPIFMTKNLGGAGGFNRGIKQAMAMNSDYIWVMDDDTIPTQTALEEILKAKEEIGEDNFSFLASNVRWIDGEPCLMNIPRVLKDWNKLDDYVELEFSSFVSMFINATSVKKVGYPITDFFIWGDDVEYAKRLRHDNSGYYVPHSVVIHKMAANTRTDIFVDHKDRLPRYFYAERNGFYNDRQDGIKEMFKHIIIRDIWVPLKILFTPTEYKFKKITILLKGFFAGLVFNPKIEQYDGELEHDE